MKTHENAKAVMDLLNLRGKLVAEQKEVSELPFSDEAFTEVSSGTMAIGEQEWQRA